MPIGIGRRAVALAVVLLAALTVLAQQRRDRGPEVRKIKGVNYPRLANLAGIQGSVELKAKVSANGIVEGVRVISGHELLVGSARQALQGWEFRCPDRTASCEVSVTFTFELLDDLCDRASCPGELEVTLPNAVTVRAKRLRAIAD